MKSSIVKALAVASVFACAQGYAIEKREEHHHLLYEGNTNAQYWSSIEESYSLCNSGKNQSPINFNLESTTVDKVGSPELKYNKETFETGEYWMNNGHSVQYQFNQKDNANKLVMNRDGAEWNLVQFHFHTPSEHHVNGKFYDTEVHFVHANKDGKNHVVGFFGEVNEDGKDNEWLEALFKVEPTEEKEEYKNSITLPDLQSLLNEGVHSYNGSLTTPPCTEDVKWLVATKPFSLSLNQLRKLQGWMGFNARPTQINLNYNKDTEMPKNFNSAEKCSNEESGAASNFVSMITISIIAAIASILLM
ncbi:carbonic anhydrase [Piromyces finnis]|uniref:Carbonic anhydrase n=1 Tax=Piromyces finnis TaxID=1754191 RepID=A0A1Y1V2Y8_9FUNG|nr:carbonic anhydrase [Piromyces finnis]|eukprot:ORX44711.1 carbonic anhydrase [Piromyces finnis]